MEREKVITTLEDIADDLGVVCVNELDRELWHYYGWQLWSKLNRNKVLLLNFLESEYQAGHRISPLIIVLRERMEKAIRKINPLPFDSGFGDEIYNEFYDIANQLYDWLNWINRYYPPEQSTQELPKEPVKQDEDLKSCFLVQDDKKNELLKKLHLLIDGKKGKSVALVIHLCVELGLMSKPTFGVLKAEFGNIGNVSGFNSYYGKYETSYTKEEKDGLKRHFEPFLEYI